MQLYSTLLERLKQLTPFAVAYSGGADSSFLATAARESCGDSVIAITVASEFQSEKEIEAACKTAKMIGIRHVILRVGLLDREEIVENTRNRCYFCKKFLFSKVKDKAKTLGMKNVVHGVNLDDLNDFRPGYKAALELGIRAPLVEAGFSKEDIRLHSRMIGLDTWNKPSQSCLATRVPYGEKITLDRLTLVEKSEQFLSGIGFKNVRVRCHQNIARIEIAQESMKILEREETRKQVVEELKLYGFTHVTLDLEGYVSGSMNRS